MKHMKMTSWIFTAILLFGVLAASAKRLPMDLCSNALKIKRNIIEGKFT